ncbi:MAG: hypothetical protein JSW73_03540 [Candidatus Woesearchaeota archaeon]|nr:MAG: hypothetical protein JSW73_03540 [Candidatus Woesearchaeota archaeon]
MSFLSGILFYIIPLYIIVCGIVYHKTKKLSNMFFAISIITYFVSIIYAISKFNLGGSGILLSFILSAVLMILIGHSLKKTESPKRPVVQTYQPQRQQYIPPNYPQNQNMGQNMRNYPQNQQDYQNERR